MNQTLTVPDWLAADSEWLAAQPGMNPWPDSAARVLSQLKAWATGYTAKLAVRAGELDPHLWACWGHHWRTAVEAAGKPVDGWEVAAEIEAGRGRKGRGQLGGNVVRDVVLARAMLLGDNDAIRWFEKEYQDTISRQVASARRSARDDESWWNALLAELVGVHREGRAGRLARFQGRSGLVPWVVTVAIRFLCDRPNEGILGAELEVEPAAPGVGKAGPLGGALSEECMDLLARRVGAALGSVTRDHRLVLRMAYVDGLSGQEIARVLKIHPGNVTRRRQDALVALQQNLAGGSNDAEAIGDCLGHLFEGGRRQDLAEALTDVLRASATEAKS